MSAQSCLQDKKGLSAPRFGTHTLHEYLRPIWCATRVTAEPCMAVGEGTLPLLYSASRVLRVENYELTTTYQEGVDFALAENGLIRLESGKMPHLALEDYYISKPNDQCVILQVEPSKAWRYIPEREYLYFGERDTFTQHQVVVTYETKDAWDGFIPKDYSHRFPRLYEKLKRKENLHILFYGDSITFGCNASGTPQQVKTAPYMPCYGKLVTTFLEEVYGTSIQYTNTSVCGHNSRQGLDEIDSRVIAHTPDLVVLAFGANDRDPFTLEEHEMCAREMITRIHAALPDTEILIVSPITPNPEVKWWCGAQHTEFWRTHEALTREFPFVTHANVTLMHLSLLKHKRYFDMTGNNVNHPNDFLHRVYAQVILATLLGDGYTGMYQ